MISYVLIVLFSLLIIYNVFFKKSLIEHMDNEDSQYKDYKDDPAILAQQNAGNIQVLKDQMDKAMKIIDELKPKQDSMEKQIESNSNSINSIIQGQQDMANAKGGMNNSPSPDEITGLE